MTQTFTIAGKKNETFTISKVEEINNLPNCVKALIESGKEPVVYHMSRVIEGTRKQAHTLLCYRFVNSDSFITIL